MFTFIQIASLLSRISAYDIAILRYVNSHRFRSADQLLIFITNTTSIVSIGIAVIMLLVALANKQKDLRQISFLIIISLIVSTIITNILKYSIHRVRPFITYSYIEKLSTGGSPSFPSGHTSDAFVMATAITLFATKRPFYIALIWIWAFAVAYSRIVLGVHYPTDVLMSMIVGICSALLVRRQFKNRLKNN